MLSIVFSTLLFFTSCENFLQGSLVKEKLEKEIEYAQYIEHCKDGKYKVRNANGKAILHEDYTDAVKLALEVYEKFKKFNKDFEG